MKILLLALGITSFTFNPVLIEPCDLLEEYASRPEHLKFEECTVVNLNQTKLKARYSVPGKDAFVVEQFLMDKYGMEQLKFVCCGWEAQSVYFHSEELKKINGDYVLEISMFGNAEKVDKTGEVILEMDREKVNFWVEVTLLEV